MPTELRSPFLAPADDLAPTDARPLSCRIAADPLEVELHHRIRREIFVAEQAIFAGDDRDARDDDPEVLKVLGLCGPTAAGAVRLYRIDAAADTWMGDRLAVLRRFRRHGLGAPLVRFAVRTAGQRGGRVMLAHIQPANVRWFERLGWERSGDPEIYVGLPHQPMQIALDAAAPSGVTSRSSERASADR